MMIKAIFTLTALLAVAVFAGCGDGEESDGPTTPAAAGDSQGLTADHSHEPTPEHKTQYLWSAGPRGGGAQLNEYWALRECTGKPDDYWDDQPWPPELNAEEDECVKQHMAEVRAKAEATRTARDAIEAYCEELDIDEGETPETWGEAARVTEKVIDAFEDVTPPGELEGFHTIYIEYAENIHAVLKSEDGDKPFDLNSVEIREVFQDALQEYHTAVVELPGNNPLPRLRSSGCDV